MKKNKIKNYRIYAVIDHAAEIAFVGESINPDIQSILRKHRTGQMKCTFDYFYGSEDLEFVLLDIVQCRSDESLKHILAWGYFFQKLGYHVLMHPYRLTMLSNLKEDTYKVYKAVCEPYTLDDVLTRKVRPPTTSNEEVPSRQMRKKTKHESEATQMNIRVPAKVKDVFGEFCDDNQLTRSQGLSILLQGSSNEDVAGLVTEFSKLKQDNARLKGELDKATTNLKSSRNKYKNWVKALAGVLNHSAKQLSGASSNNTPLAPIPFHTAKDNYDYDSYNYPTSSGTMEITMDCIVRNKRNRPEPMFILGRTSGDNQVKFRLYPKDIFSGKSPLAPEFAYLNSRWVLGFIISADGAADIIAAMPMDIINTKKVYYLIGKDGSFIEFDDHLGPEIVKELQANAFIPDVDSFNEEISNDSLNELDQFPEDSGRHQSLSARIKATQKRNK